MSGYEWIGLMMVDSGGFPVLIQNNHSWNIHSSWPSIVFDDDDDDDDDGDGDDYDDDDEAKCYFLEIGFHCNSTIWEVPYEYEHDT